jgi:hypothetical protein
MSSIKPMVLNEKEAAIYIGMSTSFLSKDRIEGIVPQGPPWIKVGRAIRYSVKDLDIWLEKCRVRRN